MVEVAGVAFTLKITTDLNGRSQRSRDQIFSAVDGGLAICNLVGVLCSGARIAGG